MAWGANASPQVTEGKDEISTHNLDKQGDQPQTLRSNSEIKRPESRTESAKERQRICQ